MPDISTVTEEQVRKMTVKELKSELTSRSISPGKMRKPDLVDAVLGAIRRKNSLNNLNVEPPTVQDATDIQELETKLQKVKLSSLSLHRNALKILVEGAKSKDGPGYIYMYNTTNLPHTYKIGISRLLDPSKPVMKTIQSIGDMECKQIFHRVVANVNMVDSAIKAQLETCNFKNKDGGDGFTEWYAEDLDTLLENISLVIKAAGTRHPEIEKS
jgi:hypothetical protein